MDARNFDTIYDILQSPGLLQSLCKGRYAPYSGTEGLNNKNSQILNADFICLKNFKMKKKCQTQLSWSKRTALKS